MVDGVPALYVQGWFAPNLRILRPGRTLCIYVPWNSGSLVIPV
jgi:DNA modification methylase